LKIQVKVFGTLQGMLPEYDGRNPLDLEVPDHTTVAEMIGHLKLPRDDHFSVIVNGDIKKPGDLLQPGDAVSIFIPVAGG
jgi:sulfur carrier protein ThiS